MVYFKIINLDLKITTSEGSYLPYIHRQLKRAMRYQNNLKP